MGGGGIPSPRRPWRPTVARLLRTGAATAVTLGAADLARAAWTLPPPSPADTDPDPSRTAAASQAVSVIIPTLQEGRRIEATVRALKALAPPPAEVIVSDGGSTDGTVAAARRAGARVVRAGTAGRAAQMNAGAAVASFSLLWFVHADSRPPRGGVAALRRALRDPGTVAGGFTTLIRYDGRPPRQEEEEEDTATPAGPLCLSMTLHNWGSTFYAPLLARPWAAAAGLRALFGDQSIFVRASDFGRVGGYRADLPLMEDLALVVDLHVAGPTDGAAHGVRALWVAGPLRGRVRQLGPPCATTSARRFVGWGSPLKATAIHFAVALAWYAGAPPHVLEGVVRALYPAVSDVR